MVIQVGLHDPHALFHPGGVFSSKPRWSSPWE